MKVMLFNPIVLSLVVLGAHFLRSGNPVGVVGILGLLPLLAIRRAWVARLTQVVLILGALEWLRTIVLLARWRSENEQPVLRMAVILAAVAAVAFGSALLFQTSAVGKFYRSREGSE